jgi:hypothetical protein
VYLLSGGRVAAEGSLLELAESSGLFGALMRRQAG